MSEGTAKARIVWVDRRPRPDGGVVCEVIYEVDAEPDLLRQIEVPEKSLYDGATRGDAIEVVGGERIVPIGRQSTEKKESER